MGHPFRSFRMRLAALAMLAAAALLLIPSLAPAGADSDFIGRIAIHGSGSHQHVFLRSRNLHIAPGSPQAGRSRGPIPVPLQYHQHGLVMSKGASVYVIFWWPNHLQNGHVPQPSAKYKPLIARFFRDVGGSGLLATMTQYFQKVNNKFTFVPNVANLAGTFTDTTPYPAADCHDPDTPAANCISDKKIQGEIKKVAAQHHLTPGNSNLFFVFTAQGEGSCQVPGATQASKCFAGGGYCAYHSFVPKSSPPTVANTFLYANMPYMGDALTGCGLSDGQGGVVAPNDQDADVAIGVTSHELMEAMTDPYPNTGISAWFDSNGQEVADKCGGNPGPGPYWANDTATHMWNGNLYAMQSEWDNHALLDDSQHLGFPTCVQAGP
jgi:hypothetical protein